MDLRNGAWLPRVLLSAACAAAWTMPTAMLAQDVSDLAGCYEVRAGEWSDADRHAHISNASVPDTIALREEVSDLLLGRGQFVLEPYGAFARPRGMGGAFWRAEGDSISLIWTTGHSGLLVRAERRRDELIGTVVSFWDNSDGSPAPQASWEARRIPCPDGS